ncbi:MAG TPA: DUF4388 domain-containing protein, partial [Candidatus Obscuribacterales bacterium]|nr:DUF4388 domain-containing protein [Candidatus Obscuribacterales bacterium]
MLQKNVPQRPEGRKNHQLPLQDTAPSFQQIEDMSTWANIPTNKGKTIELPFREFVLMAQKVGALGLEWILYRNDGVTSAREWTIVNDDVNIIHNTICAQFPDAEVSLATSARLGPTSVHLDGMVDEVKAPAAPAQGMAALSKKGKPSMSGGLRPSQLPALLQSIALGNMTGNLEIVATNDTAELYFQDGKLYHCSVKGVEGDGAVVELASWDSGDYSFYPDLTIDKMTVRNRLENLLMEGMTLLDHTKSLAACGMTMESYVVRIIPGITEHQFEQMVAQGIPADWNFQKSLYQTIDDKTQMVEILRRFPFPKRFWVPTIFNLMQCKLIKFVDAAPHTAPAAQPQAQAAAGIEPLQVDWQQVRTLERTLMRSDTGIFSYAALLLFLEREFARNERFHRPFSLIVIEGGVVKPEGIQPLSADGLKLLAQKIDKLKRKTDTITHFEMFGLAILLPETLSASARSFVSTLTEAIYKGELIPGVPNESLKLEFGVSGIPDECSTLEMLLALAKPKR